MPRQVRHDADTIDATVRAAIEPGADDPRILDVRLPRRTLLRLAGLAALGIVGAERVLGAVAPRAGRGGDTMTAAAPDPIEVLAGDLEYDVERIFRFVADEVRYEPYEGILRGARGTLAGRAGNSLDQALLLAALLDASGVPVRFVDAAIDERTAGTMLASTAVTASVALDEAMAVLRGSGGTPAGRTSNVGAPSPDPGVRAAVDRIPEVAAAVQAAARSQVDASLAMLGEALAGAGVTLPSATSVLPPLELARHAWVQAASGPDWLDLDPTLPTNGLGDAPATPTGEPATALPDGLRHRVAIRVLRERLVGGALTEDLILEHEAFADELAGEPLVLLHEKPAGLEAMGISVTGALTGQTHYLPILQVGGRSLIGLAGITLGGGGGARGGVGGESDADGEATAEWLEVDVTAPDGTARRPRRPLFARVGDVARATGTFDATQLPPVELLDLGEQHAAEYLPLRTLHFIAVTTGPTSGDIVRRAGEGTDGMGLFQWGSQLYQLGRDAIEADLALPLGVRTFIDAPNVVTNRLGLEIGPDGVPTTTAGFDLLLRSFGHLPVADVPPRAAPGLVSGVISHVAERLALGDGLPPDIAGPGSAVSVGAVLERARAVGVPLRVLRGTVPDDLAYPEAARRRLAAALGDGWVAVAPAQPVTLGDVPRTGWWLVDPATGRAVDMMDDGRGAEGVEYPGVVASIPWRAIGSFAKLGLCVLELAHQLYLVFEVVTGDAGMVYGLVLGALTHRLGHWACH